MAAYDPELDDELENQDDSERPQLMRRSIVAPDTASGSITGTARNSQGMRIPTAMPQPRQAPQSVTGITSLTPPPTPTSITEPPNPLGNSQPQRPMGAAEQRLRSLTEQGAPPVTQLHGAKRVLDVLGQAIAPHIEQDIRYGPQNAYKQNLAQAEGDFAAENKLNTEPLTEGQDIAKTRQENALADQEEANAKKALNPSAEKPENIQQVYSDAVQDAINRGVDPNEDPTVLRVADTITRLQKEPAAPKEANPEAQTFESLVKGGMTPAQAYQKLKEMGREPTAATEGTWTLDEDASGKPILFNSKTGATREAPAGLEKTGTKAKADEATKKLTEPIQAAEQYADDYLNNGRFTGPGDEALQEKFFELAKPTTGFRMSQPQMDMLQNSRSWMSSAEAHLRHMASGTWFSNEQRQQIVGTMKELAAAKMAGVQQGGGAAAAGSGAAANDLTNFHVNPQTHERIGYSPSQHKWLPAPAQ